jgi:hypothetical protein
MEGFTGPARRSAAPATHCRDLPFAVILGGLSYPNGFVCPNKRRPGRPMIAIPTMRFFLAGIMQGSLTGPALHAQDYRGHLKQLIEAHFPEADIYDPLADHADSIGYDDTTGRDVFFGHNFMCRDIDVLIAFVPEASMGTAIEMWEAYQHGAAVFTISPMVHNWAVKFLSHEIFRTLEACEEAVVNGGMRRRITEIQGG